MAPAQQPELVKPPVTHNTTCSGELNVDYEKYFNTQSLEHARCEFYEKVIIKAEEMKSSCPEYYKGWSTESIRRELLEEWDRFFEYHSR